MYTEEDRTSDIAWALEKRHEIKKLSSQFNGMFTEENNFETVWELLDRAVDELDYCISRLVNKEYEDD